MLALLFFGFGKKNPFECGIQSGISFPIRQIGCRYFEQMLPVWHMAINEV